MNGALLLAVLTAGLALAAVLAPTPGRFVVASLLFVASFACTIVALARATR